MEKQMRELLKRNLQDDKVVAYIESLEMDNMLLTRENQALTIEGELKCELNQELQKQVTKLCERNAKLGFCHGTSRSSLGCKDKEHCTNCWKEWAKRDE